MRKFHLFVDLDGVLAGYDEGFKAKFGCSSREFREKNNVTVEDLENPDKCIWEAIGSDPLFYSKLPMIDGALDFWSELIKLHPEPVILTSAGRSHFVQNAAAKALWVEDHLFLDDGWSPGFVPVRSGRRKAAYAFDKFDILIDDWEPNLGPWTANGGTAVHHQGDYGATLEAVRVALQG